MNIGKAKAIFDNIKDSNVTLEEKGEAIKEIMELATHNSVTKEQALHVIDFLWHLVFDVNGGDEE